MTKPASPNFIATLLHKSHEIQRVRISEQEYRKLVSLLGSETLVKQYVISIDEYCLMHGKNYKDYAAAVRVWWRRDRERDAKNRMKAHERFEDNKRERTAGGGMGRAEDSITGVLGALKRRGKDGNGK